MRKSSDLSALPEEQAICVNCGFCCDGTLFLHANLNPGERGNLPEKIEANSYTEGGNDYFRLPCKYFRDKCTIYDQKKAYVCSSYRCQLLKEFAAKNMTPGDAMEIVRAAGAVRKELMEEFKRLTGRKADNFMQLLQELGKMMKSQSSDEASAMDHEILQARCNIFEALLIRHFRSAEAFDKMIMK